MPIASAKEILRENAQKLVKEKKLDKAVEELLKIPRYYEYSDICIMIAEILLKNKNEEEAAYYFNIVHELEPDNEYIKQRLRELSGDKEEAEEEEEPEEENDEEAQMRKKFLPKGSIPTERFTDVIGMDEIKEKLKEKVMLALKKPELFEKYDKQRTAGILLYSAPGNGKTYIIKSLAGETGINFIEVKISEVVSKWTGDTEKHIQAIFDNAKKYAPCIIFIDEMDSLGQKRANLSGEGSAVVMKQAIEAFLQIMDGISSSKDNVYVIGATNQPWDIDEALKRPGRFGDSIYVKLPSYKDRKGLFRYYLKGIKVRTRRINYGRLARSTFYYSPADIKAICDDVKSRAISYENKNGKEKIIGTTDLLYSTSKRESSSIAWFNTIKKELLSVKKVDKVDGRKVKSELQGKLTKGEKNQYKPLIREFNRYLTMKDIYSFLRLIALYLI